MGRITLEEIIKAHEKINEAKPIKTKIIGTRAYLKSVVGLTDQDIASGRAYGMEVVLLEGKCKLQK